MSEWAEVVRETGELFDVLGVDIVESENRLARKDSEVERRNRVRATFALFEGSIAVMKRMCLHAAEIGLDNVTEGELALLRERVYALDKGHVVVKPHFIELKQNVRFTLRMVARRQKTDASPDYSGVGWQAFRDAIKIRNRITHPRSPADCRVSNEDLATVRSAQSWFHEAVTTVFRRRNT